MGGEVGSTHSYQNQCLQHAGPAFRPPKALSATDILVLRDHIWTLWWSFFFSKIQTHFLFPHDSNHTPTQKEDVFFCPATAVPAQLCTCLHTSVVLLQANQSLRPHIHRTWKTLNYIWRKLNSQLGPPISPGLPPFSPVFPRIWQVKFLWHGTYRALHMQFTSNATSNPAFNCTSNSIPSPISSATSNPTSSQPRLEGDSTGTGGAAGI